MRGRRSNEKRLANSADVAGHFSGYLARNGLVARPVTVAPLGVEPAFLDADRDNAFVPARPTFVVCGTIEPRKNHLLLLNLWRSISAELGDGTPDLVVGGDHDADAPGCSSPAHGVRCQVSSTNLV